MAVKVCNNTVAFFKECGVIPNTEDCRKGFVATETLGKPNLNFWENFSGSRVKPTRERGHPKAKCFSCEACRCTALVGTGVKHVNSTRF